MSQFNARFAKLYTEMPAPLPFLPPASRKRRSPAPPVHELTIGSFSDEPSKPCVDRQLLQDDGRLLAGIRRGEEAAMAILFDRYSRLVYSVALRVLGDKASAEDAMQETFMKLWRSPDSFISTKGRLGGWLAVVTRNRAIDMLRQRRPNNALEQLDLESHGNLAADEERSSLDRRVWSAVNSLPTQQRKYIEMAYSLGMTHDEIAKRTGDPIGTVKTRMRRALSTLRTVCGSS